MQHIAKINEIFSSIQGEGIYIGEPQIFIRFAKCNLHCDFCDTKKNTGKAYGAYDILNYISSLNTLNIINAISITGGEPLLHTDFLRLILPQLKKRSFKIYLETNGTLPGSLNKVLDLVDVIAMDIKLPSAQKNKKNFWATHKDFLNIARKKDVFVKVVVTSKTTEDEIKKAARLIDDLDPDIPLVLQPVVPANRVRKKATVDRICAFQKLAKSVLNDVRVIPQMHKILGIQ